MAKSDLVAQRSRIAIERGSKSFALASHLFDSETRESAHLLYAWCRYCDDVIDGQELGFRAEELGMAARRMRLKDLEDKTRRAMGGDPTDDPIFVALARVVSRHRIPERHPLELLEGFAMDVDEHVYARLDDTLRYCYHVAGVVGVMMGYIMGVRDAATLNRASDLGIALQLTNIARDVPEDARIGRVYLPADWLAEAGLVPNDVLQPEARSALCRVVERLLAEADRYYASGRAGITRLPLRSAWAVATAAAVYGDIGRVVRERGRRAWDERAMVGKGRKLWLAGVGAWRALASRASSKDVTRAGLWTMENPELGS